MRPFTKDIQPVVINGRRQSKLEPPKSKSAAALAKRKNRNARRKSHYQHHHNSNNSSGNNSCGNISSGNNSSSCSSNQNNNDDNDDHDNSVGHHDDDLAKEPCQFVPVRRKPLGEYMNLEASTLTSTATAAAAAAAAATTGATTITTATTTAPSVAASPAATSSSSLPSTAMQGMRMSYAAAVQTGLGVKVMISPRLKKFNNKPGSKGQKANNHNNNHHSKITADTKFRIFDEQPHKPHIVRVDPKVFRADVEAMKATARLKTTKTKKPSAAAAAGATTTTPRILTSKTSELPTKPKAESEDAEIKELELQFKKLACNADDTAANAENVMQTARNLNSIQGSSSTASNDSEGTPINQHHNTINNNNNNVKSPTFVDSISYLSFHHERLQRIVKNQSICVICLQSPEPMKVPQFEDKHFKYLEEASLLAQNRTMLRLWLNSDQLIC
ncbi:probable serine/threonine-protein kinase DDB_G0278845 [Drosophila mojavensis]|uniref:probable serine/threonine-protein kinase DDB_G0278845 n=1 Tax=Drosophila mojavensis TaxID=7230 RepID=UPI00017C93AD|nr:probable serine/threonine-protein kinase DDB_G0278845 [Drosophila mojavensis]